MTMAKAQTMTLSFITKICEGFHRGTQKKKLANAWSAQLQPKRRLIYKLGQCI